MKRISFWVFILSVVLLFTSCDTSLNEYKPKSDDEKQIIAFLNTYLDARNKGDLKRLQSTFHDKGVYISNDGLKITRAAIVDTKAEWWVNAGEIQLKNPVFKIEKNEAKVMVTTKHGAHYKTANIYNLVKERNNWLIQRVE